jgi:hypothetical protein
MSPPCRDGVACEPQWPYELCRQEVYVPGRVSQAGQIVSEKADWERETGPPRMGVCGWAGNSPKEDKVLISKDAQLWISADHMTRDLARTISEIQIQTKLDQPSWKNGQHQTSENTPLTTNLEGEKMVDTPRKDGNALMPEQVKRPDGGRWRWNSHHLRGLLFSFSRTLI